MPIRFACHQCGKPYSVRDEYAGRKTKCTACGTPLTVPANPGFEVVPDEPASPANPGFEVVPDEPASPANPGFEVVPDEPASPANPGFEVVPDDEVTLTPLASATAEQPMLIWTNPDTTEQNIVMLSDDVLWASRLPERALPAACAKLRAGQPPAAVLGQRVNRIPLDQVKRVIANDQSTEVDVDHSSPITTATIGFDSLEARDEFFAELKERLPGRWTLGERKPKIWPRLSQPLAAIGLTLVIGFFLIPAASTAQETRSGPGARSVRIEGIIFILRGFGPIGVGLIVLLALLGFIGWLAYEISRIPPKRVVLAPRESKA
jgi:hypothetical protein